MKQGLLLIYFLLIFSSGLQAQRDNTMLAQKSPSAETVSISVNIYPVPVKDNSFTIKSDREISFIRVTNIIGQDVLRSQYSDPQRLIKVSLDNPKRGMYLVTIIFTDGIRVVKKIMVEQSE